MFSKDELISIKLALEIAIQHIQKNVPASLHEHTSLSKLKVLHITVWQKLQSQANFPIA